MPNLIVQSLLQKNIDPHTLYLILNNSGSKGNPDERGLGDSFKKKTRADFITAALDIDDNTQKVTGIKSKYALAQAALIYMKGNASVNPNPAKAARLYGLLSNCAHLPQPDNDTNDYTQIALEQLFTLYNNNGLPDDRFGEGQNIYALVIRRRAQYYKDKAAAALNAQQEAQAALKLKQEQEAAQKAQREAEAAAALKLKQEKEAREAAARPNGQPIGSSVSGSQNNVNEEKSSNQASDPAGLMTPNLIKLKQAMRNFELLFANNGLADIKAAQKSLFISEVPEMNHLKQLTTPELKTLLQAFRALQLGTIKGPLFEVIRTKQNKLTQCFGDGKGYTKTLEIITHAVKTEYIAKLTAEASSKLSANADKNAKLKVDPETYTESQTLLSEHYGSSFFGRWGKTTSLKQFNKQFEVEFTNHEPESSGRKP